MTSTVSLADFSCIADSMDGTSGTDNTVNIQAAIDATPIGGTLFIPPNTPVPGLDAPGYGFGSSLVFKRPINICGGDMYSRLVPLSSFSPTAPNMHIYQNTISGSAYYWGGIEWRSFQLGTSWFNPPFQRYGGEGIFVDAISIPKFSFINLLIGESGNGRSLRVTGTGTQHSLIDRCTIHGGIGLDNVADGHTIQGCDIGGRSIYSGVLAYMPGAGSLKIINNPSVTAVGGIVVQGVSMPIIENNYCEELPGFPINNYANNGGYNAMIGFVGYPGNVYAGRIVRNILNMGVSGAGNGFNAPGATSHCVGLNPAVHGVINTLIAENEFNISTNRGYINSQDPNLIMGPNTYVQPSWSRFKSGSVAPTQTYGGG